MQLDISPQACDLLAEILESWRSNLRTEIHRRVDAVCRRELKEQEGVVEGVLRRLRASQPPAAAP
jgi:hypothetical protein